MSESETTSSSSETSSSSNEDIENIPDAALHENNIIMDRKIQLHMLALEEAEITKALACALASQVAPSAPAPTTNNAPIGSGSKQKSAAAAALASTRIEDFCAWCPDPNVKLRKPDKMPKNVQKEREFHVWRDYRPKEINFVFKHFGNWRRYSEQYRYEHTYNFGPLSKEMIDIQRVGAISDNSTTLTSRQKRPPPRLKSEGNLQSLSMPTSTTHTPRTQSESNILELAQKYKLTSSPPQKELDVNDLEPCITQPSFTLQNPRTGSARSRSHSAKSRSKVNIPQPTSKVPSIPRTTNASPVIGATLTPSGKGMKSNNGYALDASSLSKKAAPTLLLPATNTMKTLDLLSHVSTVDRQPPSFRAVEVKKEGLASKSDEDLGRLHMCTLKPWNEDSVLQDTEQQRLRMGGRSQTMGDIVFSARPVRSVADMEFLESIQEELKTGTGETERRKSRQAQSTRKDEKVRLRERSREREDRIREKELKFREMEEKYRAKVEAGKKKEKEKMKTEQVNKSAIDEARDEARDEKFESAADYLGSHHFPEAMQNLNNHVNMNQDEASLPTANQNQASLSKANQIQAEISRNSEAIVNGDMDAGANGDSGENAKVPLWMETLPSEDVINELQSAHHLHLQEKIRIQKRKEYCQYLLHCAARNKEPTKGNPEGKPPIPNKPKTLEVNGETPKVVPLKFVEASYSYPQQRIRRERTRTKSPPPVPAVSSGPPNGDMLTGKSLSMYIDDNNKEVSEGSPTGQGQGQRTLFPQINSSNGSRKSNDGTGSGGRSIREDFPSPGSKRKVRFREEQAARQSEQTTQKAGIIPDDEITADKAKVIRQYLISMAEMENNLELRDQLIRAPDSIFHSFSPPTQPGEKLKRSSVGNLENVDKDPLYVNTSKPPSASSAKSPNRLQPVTISNMASGKSRSYCGQNQLAHKIAKTSHQQGSHQQGSHQQGNHQQGGRESARLVRESSNASSERRTSVLQGLQESSNTESGMSAKIEALLLRERMWFDSSGRAYVSLATRYDPVKK